MTGNAARATQALAAFVIMIVSSVALAQEKGDFERGLEAYDGGDYETVIEFWLPLAEAGNPEAQTALGSLYLFGEGVVEDPRQAADWFRRAANQGDAVAQLNLGDLLARGHGVERDLVEAYFWLSLAAATGRSWAERRRQEIAAAMSATGRAEAEARIEAWRRRQ